MTNDLCKGRVVCSRIGLEVYNFVGDGVPSKDGIFCVGFVPDEYFALSDNVCRVGRGVVCMCGLNDIVKGMHYFLHTAAIYSLD